MAGLKNRTIAIGAVNLTKSDRVRFGATRTLGTGDLMLRVMPQGNIGKSKITGDSDGKVSAEAKSDGVHFESANWPSSRATWFIE